MRLPKIEKQRALEWRHRAGGLIGRTEAVKVVTEDGLAVKVRLSSTPEAHRLLLKAALEAGVLKCTAKGTGRRTPVRKKKAKG